MNNEKTIYVFNCCIKWTTMDNAFIITRVGKDFDAIKREVLVILKAAMHPEQAIKFVENFKLSVTGLKSETFVSTDGTMYVVNSVKETI